ncbi:hypothetical protein HN51_018458, partial [Arachis hypogaea]
MVRFGTFTIWHRSGLICLPFQAKIFDMENPDVAKFREEGHKHLDEMEFFFEEVVASSLGAWTPSEDINDSYNDRYNDEDNGNEEEGLEDELNDELTLPSAMRQKRRKDGKGISNSSTENLSAENLISNTNVSDEEFENKQKVAVKRSSWVNELLNGYPIHYYQQFRMKKLVFLHLCDVLQNTYNLKTTKGIRIHEQ